MQIEVPGAALVANRTVGLKEDITHESMAKSY